MGGGAHINFFLIFFFFFFLGGGGGGGGGGAHINFFLFFFFFWGGGGGGIFVQIIGGGGMAPPPPPPYSYGPVEPDQDQHSVGPDLGPNCLQRLSSRRQTSRLAFISKEIVKTISLHDAGTQKNHQHKFGLKGTTTLMITMFYIKDLNKP